jgi:hypothetical protein
MKVNIFTVAILSACTSIGIAQSTQPVVEQHMNHAEFHHLMQTAHTHQQYPMLADYFTQEENSYRAKAAAEKLLWNVQAQHVAVNLNKYPRPADSAHYLYDSYIHNADSAAKKAAYYEQLAR